MRKIRKGDLVEVITGEHKGSRGKVLKVIDKGQRVLIEKVNMVTRHVKRSEKNPSGGTERKEAPIHISNVMLVDPKSGTRTKVARKFVERGLEKVKVRYSNKLGKEID